jgi:hypothetical protein
MTPKKPEWFELAEADNSTSEIRKVEKKLPFFVAFAAGVAILGGSLFTNAHIEPNASAATTASSLPSSTASTSAPINVASAASKSVSAPVVAAITPIAQSQSAKSGEQGDDGEHNDD